MSVLINLVEVEILLLIHVLKDVLQIKFEKIHVKIFNLISRVNETKFLVQHEPCECKCRLNGNKNVCTSKQVWNR